MHELPCSVKGKLSAIDQEYKLLEMVKLLEDPNPDTRRVTAQRIAETLPAQQVLEALPQLCRLLNDAVTEVRAAAVEGLTSQSVATKLHSADLVKHVVVPLMNCLWDRSIKVVQTTATAFSDGPLLDELPIEAIREHIIGAALKIVQDSDFFWDRPGVAQVLAEAIVTPRLLKKLPHDAILSDYLPPLVRMIQSADADARLLAKVALRSKPLLAKLSQVNVVTCIVEPLLSMVVNEENDKGDKNPMEVRKDSVAVITSRPMVSKMPKPSVISHLISPLVKLLKHKKAVVRKMAETGLRSKGLIGRVSAEVLCTHLVKPLVTHLQHDDENVRITAVNGLTSSVLLASLPAEIIEKYVAKQLELKLTDECDSVRAHVVQAIQRMQTISGIVTPH